MKPAKQDARYTVDPLIIEWILLNYYQYIPEETRISAM